MNNIQIFEDKKVRSHYDSENETWYFSIVDIVGILTDQPSVERSRNYWKVLKSRLIKEGNETVTNCNRLKMLSEDGKMRETDVGNVEQIFRIVQSIPSPKAEPFKQWLAKLGYERLQEIQDPSLSMDRARENWKKKGRSEKWIQQRVTGQETRNNRRIYAITSARLNCCLPPWPNCLPDKLQKWIKRKNCKKMQMQESKEDALPIMREKNYKPRQERKW